jgi:hypothetical protein
MNAKWTDENGKPIIEPEKVDDEDDEVPDWWSTISIRIKALENAE